MMPEPAQARELIREFKGESYIFGAGALSATGRLTASIGSRAMVVCAGHAGAGELLQQIEDSLESCRVEVLAQVPGARPNAPREDVLRLSEHMVEQRPDVLVAVGGGSNIDAAKAAGVLATLGGPMDRFFGMGQVSQELANRREELIPMVAVQTASSSSAHLTKYANITDLEAGQKKLIVDEAIVPAGAVFQYDVTTSMPPAFTADGALDGLSHLVEVLYGAAGRAHYGLAARIAEVGVGLIVNNVERAVSEPTDLEAREALGLGTDLGGYAITIGGTNGGHLTSFSLVDILSHGRACAITNPYYTVFFAPAIQEPLRLLGRIYARAGLTTADVDSLSGRDLGVAVAEAMLTLSERIGFPTTLGQVDGFSEAHIERALAAAKDPQLRMKLENMPVPLSAELIDDYMGPILEAANCGDLALIKNVP
jgi:alcohol dehydrogenase class IV